MNLKRFAFFIGMVALVQSAYAQQNPDVEVLHVRGPIYMIRAGSANVTASIGPDGVLLVDTGPAELADGVKAAIVDVQKQLSISRSLMSPPIGGAETRSAVQTALYNTPRPPDPVRFIVNTSGRPEHYGGNAKLMIAIPEEISSQDPDEVVTHVYAHENVLLRLSGADGDAPVPYASRPSDVYSSDLFNLSSHFNGEGVQFIHIPAANTDGDSLIWFRTSDVISAGDIYRTDSYAIPDLKSGGNIQGILEGLNRLLDMAIPEYRAEGGTLIIPGHGRISDAADLANYRDMMTIMRDRIQHMISQGKTLEQIKAARPGLDYDARYAKEPGSANRFVEAVYLSLTQPKSSEQ